MHPLSVENPLVKFPFQIRGSNQTLPYRTYPNHFSNQTLLGRCGRFPSLVSSCSILPSLSSSSSVFWASVALNKHGSQSAVSMLQKFVRFRRMDFFSIIYAGSCWNILVEMAVSFSNVHSESGLEKLDSYLLTRSYITGYQASKDDLCVYSALPGAPASKFVNVCRWYDHISALLRLSGVSGEGEGIKVETSASYTEEASASPLVSDAKVKVDEEDDDDVDLFGEETEEEKKAAEERAAAIKASSKKKESGKSSVLLDIKPWDDETDMKKLEETVRSIQMEGLLWGASKLVPVGYGIKKLQIMMTIVDDLVSVDSLIEEQLTVEPANEYIQSCDIVAFNKI